MSGELTDRIAQAIGDPGSIVGRKFGPSWGEGNEGYAEREESITRWSTRAVLAVLSMEGMCDDDENCHHSDISINHHTQCESA